MSAALTIKFGGRLPDGILLADGGADNALADLVTKFGGGLPDGIL